MVGVYSLKRKRIARGNYGQNIPIYLFIPLHKHTIKNHKLTEKMVYSL